MKFIKHHTRTIFKASLFLILSILWITPASAHRNPSGCSGSGLGINLYTNISEAHIGDSISYSADIFNGTGDIPIVCNATNIQASITTPDGIVHPIPLLRTSLLNKELDSYSDILVYTIKNEDVETNGTLLTTANVIGDIHQNDTNSLGGGNQGVNVQILSIPNVPIIPIIPVAAVILSIPSGGGTFAPLPLINITKTPNPPALKNGPGSVIFTYTVKNIGTVAMRGVWVKDDKCNPVKFISGDGDNNSLLDTTESWTYQCAKIISETETNTATTHGQANGWDAYDTATSTVIVSIPTIPTIVSTPSLPNAGFSPEERVARENIIILSIIITLVSYLLVSVSKKMYGSV